MSLQCFVVDINLIEINLFKSVAMQKWWEKAWQQKGIKYIYIYIPLPKLSTKT